MSGFRGRALIYPGLLIAGWIVGRSISLSATPAEPLTERTKPADVRLASNHPIWPDTACPMPLMAYPTAYASGYNLAYPTSRYGQSQRHSRRWNSSGGTDSNSAFPSSEHSVGPELESFRLSALPAAMHAQAEGETGAATPPAKQRRLQFYSYNFWRQGSTGAALAPNAQYGGSQYGAIATWDPFGSAGKGPALAAARFRHARWPSTGSCFRFTLATRSNRWPVSLSAERRFRFYGPDGFAAYVSGGVDRVPLVGKLTLDAYGQAGYALGGISSPFVDAQAMLQHPLASNPVGIPSSDRSGCMDRRAERGPIARMSGRHCRLRSTTALLISPFNSIGAKGLIGNAAPVDGMALDRIDGFLTQCPAALDHRHAARLNNPQAFHDLPGISKRTRLRQKEAMGLSSRIECRFEFRSAATVICRPHHQTLWAAWSTEYGMRLVYHRRLRSGGIRQGRADPAANMSVG